MDASVVADRIIDEARKWLGTPYRRGGNGPKVFDCTGFTKCIFSKFGYKLGRTVPAQAVDGRELTGQLSDLQKGDILIFGSRGNKRRMGHAAIFIGLDSTGTDCSFIHAARTGVIVSKLSETYYTQRFLGARRILPDFVKEPAADSAMVALLEDLAKNAFVPVRDTLSLSPADRRIILFADGTWAVVDSLGGLSVPSGGERLVLAESGSWTAVTASSVRIPELRESAESEKPASSSGTVRQTAPPPPADGSAVYHTIVSGDTLSGIAKRYGTTVQKLCNLNGITVKTTLKLGRKLRVKCEKRP